MPLADLVTTLNAELRDTPPGPERDQKLREIAQGFLDRAKTPTERLFWGSFLKEVDPVDPGT
jgi:hypothetical protein